VIGNRFAEMDDDAMRALNGFGNRMINRAFGFVHGANYEDILSGYRAFTVESFERLSLDSDGFTIETELAVECVKHGVETTVVPVSYRARPDESETNLHPVTDGGTILLTLYSLAKTNNPCSTSAVSGSPVSFRAVSLRSTSFGSGSNTPRATRSWPSPRRLPSYWASSSSCSASSRTCS